MNARTKNGLRVLPLLAVLSLVFMGADECSGDSAPAPDSDSDQSYKSGSKIPVDDAIYSIHGVVVGPVSDLTRQTDPGGGTYSQYGEYASGSFTGPVTKGKGFVRLYVDTVAPSSPSAKPGRIVIVKTTDTKATALLTGDAVTFKCRRQYEALAAARENEKFDVDKAATWEWDYCRMEEASIEVDAMPEVTP